MLASWLPLLYIGLLLVMDLLLIGLLVVLGALFTGFVGFKALSDFIEKLIDQLIKDILKSLDDYLKARTTGKVGTATAFLMKAAKTIYTILYAGYSLIGLVTALVITAGAGVLALAALSLLVLINLTLAYLVVLYIL